LSGFNTEVFGLFFGSLESTVTELGGGIDELQVDLFKSSSGGLGEQALSEDQSSLLGSDAASLDQDEVVVNNTVVGETTQRSDGLFGQISSSGSVVLATFVFNAGTDSVDLLVDFSSVMVTVLTSSGDAVSDSSRMPATDATNSSETSVGLSGQSLGAPSGGGAFESLTLGNTDNVDHFVLFEDGGDSDFLFEVGNSPVDLSINVSTVDLDFADVSLLLSEVEEVHLGVDEDSDDLAVFLDSVDLSGEVLVVLHLFSVLAESLFLGVHPVLVQSSLEFVGEMLGPDGGEGSEASGSLNISNNTDNNDGRSFEDGACFDDFLLVQLGARLLDFSQDMGHTGLEDGEGSEVDLLGGIVLREGTNSSSMMLCSLSGKESQGSVPRSLEFSVRHSP